MSLDYQRLKQKNSEEGAFWTSYSDLFMVLSVVFLLLYVVASLRSGTDTVQKQIEFKRLKAESMDLKKQIQAYNALKNDYLEKEASAEESQMYEELMSKLSLLQDEANQEKKQLENQAQENAAKAQALNQYQQMVRNIVNTNLLSKKKIKFRDDVIVKKNDAIHEMDSTIQTQVQDIREKETMIQAQDKDIRAKQEVLDRKKQEVALLEQAVQEKSQTIANNQAKINNLNSELSQKIKEFEKTSESAKLTKTELSRKIALMKLENAKKIGELQGQSDSMKAAVEGMNQKLSDAESQLQNAKGRLSEQEEQKKKLEGEIAEANATYQKKMGDMTNSFNEKIKAQRQALEDQLGKEKASADEKLKRLGDFKNKVAAEKAELDKQLAHVRGEADGLKGKLADAQKEHGRYMAAIDQLKKDKDGLSGDLKRANELTQAKQKLARKIADNLIKNGIKAGVDGKNGDVTIQFGDEYFDTGRADLKPNMKSILQKFVPTYSKSLLEDEKVAKEISSVEIIGFSSPTYNGRYVDPQSLNDADRAAVSYNMDLSFNRAKSIFSYIFDKKNMNYQYQKDLLPLVKVTGRSFLAEDIKGRNIASALSMKDYCAQYNCEKSQKVIIRFNLKD